MKIIEVSIRRPTSIVVAVLLAVIFGVMALLEMPIQMRPTTDPPLIRVEVMYPGVAPAEIEAQLTTPMEQRLNTVQNLRRITSQSSTGRSRIDLHFDWGINKEFASLDVLKKLNQVRNVPEDAESPVITAATSDERIVSFMGVKSKTIGVDRLLEVVDGQIVPMIERVEGVGLVRVFGGREREIQIVLDYEAMTSRGISIDAVRRAIGNENRNARGGHIDQGKRRVMVRTLGQFESLEDLENVIVDQRREGTVRLRDIARVVDGYKDIRYTTRTNGETSIGVGVVKRSGANTIKVMAGVDAAVAELRPDLESKGIEILKLVDDTEYIWDSIDQVVSNLEIGGVLACVVLLLFLRNVVSTVIISFAIPLSLIASFILLRAAGSSLNIITLAGMAFAVGMVVDNAIVVLENIFRHGEMGETREKASFVGAEQVWGAILASTLTTLAVFLPIIFVKEEVGQLFRDIALSISFAIVVSLIVSITVIPMLTSRWMGGARRAKAERSRGRLQNFLSAIGSRVSRFFLGSVSILIRGVVRKVAFVSVILVLSGLSLRWLPPAEYLPIGSMNVIRGGMSFPPGTNVEQADYLMRQVEERFMNIEELEGLFVVTGLFNAAWIVCKEEFKGNLQPIIKQMRNLVKDIPGARVGISQRGVFGRASGGKSIVMRIRGKDLASIQGYVTTLEDQLNETEGVLSARTSLNVNNPELQIRIDRDRAAQLGMTVRSIAETVETLVGGRVVSLYRIQGVEIDIALRGDPDRFRGVDDIQDIRVYTPAGAPVRLGSLIEVNEGLGPTRIDHWNMDRMITMTVRLEEDIPLEVMLTRIRDDVVAPVQAEMPLGYTIELGETASKLSRTKQALGKAFLLAVVIIYLLMASLFESFRYPLIILFSVPLAMTGAIAGIVVTGSQFNVITMLGFIILSGIVVNNAILLIHQAIRSQKDEGLGYDDAILESCRTRLRPIFMSTMTSVLGMMPLAAGSGAGTELYSGLGAAIVGGLMVSTLFTLILVPVLFSLFNDFSVWVGRITGRDEEQVEKPRMLAAG